VRHPIYSGLILAEFATAIEKGTSFAMLGAAIMTLAFYHQSASGGTLLALRTAAKTPMTLCTQDRDAGPFG